MVKTGEVKIYHDVFSERRKKLAEYCDAIDKIVPELHRELREKNTITISKKDLAKKMGPVFEKKYDILGSKILSIR